jgi:hypothetical protein
LEEGRNLLWKRVCIKKEMTREDNFSMGTTKNDTKVANLHYIWGTVSIICRPEKKKETQTNKQDYQI